MKTTKIVTLISFMFVALCLSTSAYAGEIITGDAMADKGKTIKKTGLTFLPHAEIEYGIYDFDAGFSGEGEGNGSGLALGMTVGKNKFYTDLYGRIHLSSDEMELNSQGVNFTKIIGRGTYISCAIEHQEVDLNDSFGSWSSSEWRLKPGIGGSWSSKNGWTGVVGGGIIVGKGDVEIDQEGWLGQRYQGSGDYTSFGWFVQNKLGYNFSRNFGFISSLVAEGVTSIDDVEVQNKTFSTSSLSLYFRLGFQYRF